MKPLLLLLLLLSAPAHAGWQRDCLNAARVCRQTHGLSLVTTTTTSTTSTTTTTTLQYIANPSENCQIYVPCVYIPDPRTGYLAYFCKFPDTLECAIPCPPLLSSPVSAGFP